MARTRSISRRKRHHGMSLSWLFFWIVIILGVITLVGMIPPGGSFLGG